MGIITKKTTLSSSKFIRIINTLTENELKQFEYWLKSPWCNSNKNLIRLLDKIKKYHPDFKDSKLTKERLFKKILPNGKFSDRRMNNILSEGYLAAEQFLIYQNFSRDQNLQKDILTKEFQNRHLEDWFFKDIQKEITRLEEKPTKDWEDHLDLLRLNRRMYHHPNHPPRMQLDGQTIVKMGEGLDLVYLLEKAEIIVEKTFRNRMLKDESYDIENDLKVWKAMAELTDDSSIKLYRLRFNYLEETFLEQYFDLRELLFEKIEELNERAQKVHLIAILNDTMKLVRAQKVDLSELLPVYKLGLKRGILHRNGSLTYITYFNIVIVSNTKSDFQNTLDFIDNYTKDLNLVYQADAQNWALAHTLYKQKKLKSSIDILLQHDCKIQFFQLSNRLLTSQVYFELFVQNKDSYQFFLFNYFDSFEKWLSREKLRSLQIKKSYLRFVQVIRIIAKAFDDNKFDAEKINSVLNNESNIQASQWLHEKIRELSIIKKGYPKIE